MRGTPRVTAVMITQPSRQRLAKVAIQSFLAQTYQPRDLLIVRTDPGESWVPVAGVPAGVTVAELRVSPDSATVLGELRNAALAHITTPWVIQWDDDDYHHPERIAVQMATAAPGQAVVLSRQIRYAFDANVAFVHTNTAPGIAGTILHPNDGKRYPALSRHEDTEFFLRYREHYRLVHNSPKLYLRFFHGGNTSDRNSVLKRHRSACDVWSCKADQADRLSAEEVGFLRDILAVHYGRSVDVDLQTGVASRRA